MTDAAETLNRILANCRTFPEIDARVEAQMEEIIPMRVLVACEFSGIVRDAFIAKGHDAVSCDLLLSESYGPHMQGDVLDELEDGFDMMIAFPPCTHLAVSGARWFRTKRKEQADSIGFFMALAKAPIERIAIENPIGIMSSRWRKPDQIIQPWQFGHGETKATCLWLKGLPPLVPTEIVDGRKPRVHFESPGPDRWKNRSRTLPGIAAAMADQWSERRPKLTVKPPQPGLTKSPLPNETPIYGKGVY